VLSRTEIVALGVVAGFELEAHRTIRQLFANTPAECCRRIAMRGMSSLQAITDADFAEGCTELERHCAGMSAGAAVEEDLDLFVFRKGKCADLDAQEGIPD
jgi:hypothetical protein